VIDALNLENIVKTYGDRRVVDGVSLDVHEGEIFGLVGPNGSGKTTTIRMALDIIRPDSGIVALFGKPPSRDSLARIGYLPEERGLFQRSKVTQILTYLGRLKRMDSSSALARADELLTRVGLYEHRDKKVSALSRGMSQLVQFAGALIHKPELIILDEPFSGLDPLNVQLMKEMIREQRESGASIIFSTHQMTDVEELCERVLLINDGNVLLYGNLAEIKHARGTHNVRIVADREPASVPGVVKAESTNGYYEYAVSETSRPEQVIRAFLDADIHVERYEVVLPTLNEIFIDEVSRARHSE
jgi:ABC-2 type transport system ATP-binding protein